MSADNLRTCSTCQNDLVCHDQGECLRPTPETDAYKGTHETHRIGGKTIYGHAEHLERQRDEARAELAAMREAIAVTTALAEWSARYPRGVIYSPTHQMDAELIELEERAKAAMAKLQPFIGAAPAPATEGGAA